MKKIASKIAATAFFACLSANSFAETNVLDTTYTTTRDCGENKVYVGPHLADYHGGYCLGASLGMATVHVEYTEDKSRCADKRAGYKGTYVGPNKAYEHGGSCLWIRGQDAVATYTTTKSCGPGYVYAGPNQPYRHGGSCIKQPSPSDHFFMAIPYAEPSVTDTYSKDCTGGTYVGPNWASRGGGQCLSLPPFEYHHSYTLDKDKCETYVGPFDASFHGGVCLWDLRENSQFLTVKANIVELCEDYGFLFAGSGTEHVNRGIVQHENEDGVVTGFSTYTGIVSELGGVCLARVDFGNP